MRLFISWLISINKIRVSNYNQNFNVYNLLTIFNSIIDILMFKQGLITHSYTYPKLSNFFLFFFLRFLPFIMFIKINFPIKKKRRKNKNLTIIPTISNNSNYFSCFIDPFFFELITSLIHYNYSDYIFCFEDSFFILTIIFSFFFENNLTSFWFNLQSTMKLNKKLCYLLSLDLILTNLNNYDSEVYIEWLNNKEPTTYAKSLNTSFITADTICSYTTSTNLIESRIALLSNSKKSKFELFNNNSNTNTNLLLITNKVIKDSDLLIQQDIELTNDLNYYNTYIIINNNLLGTKGATMRSRQFYRTGVIWCLALTLCTILGPYYLFYSLSFMFSYWWIFFIFLCTKNAYAYTQKFSFKILKYRFLVLFYKKLLKLKKFF